MKPVLICVQPPHPAPIYKGRRGGYSYHPRCKTVSAPKITATTATTYNPSTNINTDINSNNYSNSTPNTNNTTNINTTPTTTTTTPRKETKTQNSAVTPPPPPFSPPEQKPQFSAQQSWSRVSAVPFRAEKIACHNLVL